jgi:carbamate kinase
MDEATACEHAARNGWAIAKTHDHVWQRVVPSPEPIQIVELDAIRRLVDDGYVVIAVGGGGIPVVWDQSGNLHGVEAVIDKDLASVLLAQQLNADLFIISTAVRKVCLNFGKPNQRELDSMTLAEAHRYLAEGQFGVGTMAPKIAAIVRFLETGGRKALVTCPSDLEDALAGAAGTTIMR